MKVGLLRRGKVDASEVRKGGKEKYGNGIKRSRKSRYEGSRESRSKGSDGIISMECEGL